MRCAGRLLGAGLAVLALLMATSPTASAASPPRTSVIDGVEAGAGSFPYMAFVVYFEGSEVDLCSGTLVSSNVVLTAAHCAMDSSFSGPKDPAGFAVVTGNVDWAASQRTVSSVTRVAVDPGLAWLTPSGTPVRGDAALLGLSAPVAAPPVRLATTKTWTAGSPAVIVGWGRTTPDGEPPETLHAGEAVVQSSGYCTSRFPQCDSSGSLCALDYPGYRYATCHGDSGGPLLMVAPGTGEPLEIGITSFGDGECSTEQPQYFTRADAIAPWVSQKVAEWAPASPTPSAGVPAAGSASASPRAKPALPRMSRSAAESFARRGLGEGLGYRFNRRYDYRVSCSDADATAQRCGVHWYSLAYYYSGTVTVYYTFEGEKVAWDDRYRIKRVPSRCYRRCRPLTFTR